MRRCKVDLVLRSLGSVVLALGTLATEPLAQNVRINGLLPQPGSGDVLDYLATADGTRVVYRADQETDGVHELFSAPADGSSAAVKLNAPLGPEEDVTDFAIGAIGWLVYRTYDPVDFSRHLFGVPADGSASPVLLHVTGTVLSYCISADGAFVTFQASSQLVRSPIDGPGALVLSAGHDVDRSWYSADGAWAVFQASGPVNLVPLLAVPTDGSAAPVEIDLTSIEFESNGYFEDVAFTPDGLYAVYLKVREEEGSPRYTLRSALLDASQTRTLGPEVLSIAFSVGASDRVLCRAGNNPLPTVGEPLFSVRLDGTQVEQLNLPGWELAVASDTFRILPDGATVVFSARQSSGSQRALFRVPIDGSQAVLSLATSGSSLAQFEVAASTVVFRSDSGGFAGLYRVPLAGGQAPVLLNGPPISGLGALSFDVHPDGQQVLYRGDRATNGQNELHVVPLDASEPPDTLSGPLIDTGDVSSFLITPDGARALYLADGRHDEELDLSGVRIDRSSPPVTYNPRLAPGAVLGDVLSFKLAPPGPDGQALVYRADEDHDEVFDLYSAHPDGSGDPVRLTAALRPQGGACSHFVLSPTGEHVVFQDADEEDLYSVRLDPPGAPIQLDFSGAIEFAVTADGSRVVFDEGGVVGNVLFSRVIDGSEPTVLLTPLIVNMAVEDFVLDPDGDTVVYRADQDASDVIDLYAVAADGSAAPIRLSSPPSIPGGDVRSFRLSADGSLVAYRADAVSDERVDLFSVPSDGSAPAAKLSGTLLAFADVGTFAITEDATRVVYLADEVADGQDELYSAPSDGSAAALRLTVLPTGARVEPDFALSPDGLLVLYRANAASAATTELYVVETDGSSPPVKLSAPLVAGGDVVSFALAADLSHIVYLADQRSDEVFELFGRTLGAPAFAYDDLPAFGDVSAHRIDRELAHVLYLADRDLDGVVELFRAPLDGSEPPKKLSRSLAAGGNVQPTFAPLPGGRVLYRADAETDEAFELFAFLNLDLEAPFPAPTRVRSVVR